MTLPSIVASLPTAKVVHDKTVEAAAKKSSNTVRTICSLILPGLPEQTTKMDAAVVDTGTGN
jgi:hypothetical protein